MYIFNKKFSYSFVIKYKIYLNLSICIVPLGTKILINNLSILERHLKKCLNDEYLSFLLYNIMYRIIFKMHEHVI